MLEESAGLVMVKVDGSIPKNYHKLPWENIT